MNRDTYTPEQRFLSLILQGVDLEEVRLAPMLVDVPDGSMIDLSDEIEFSQLASALMDPLEGEELAEAEAVADRLEQGSLTQDSLAAYVGALESPYAGESLSRSSGQEPLKLGAKSVVQGRFYALLKQRLRADAETSLPLFPWETEVLEYEDEVMAIPVTGVAVWRPHFDNLRLPVSLPMDLMAQLFERCQSLVQVSVQEGRRLIDALDALFPGQGSTLNLMASNVILGYSRDGESLASRLLGFHVPATYAEASPQQQMTLAMVAAYELFSTLTLKLSASAPDLTRSWETMEGLLTLRAVYSAEAGSLKVEADLPAPGSLTVRSAEAATTTHRDQAGVAVLLLSEVCLGCQYDLEVELDGIEIPLKFVVQL
jgi:hypothetical protein